jgi:predicted dehydrogenase
MPETVRVGVVGTSWWADMLHLPALASHPQVQLAAICGRNRAPAEELAAKFGIGRVFTDYRAMIESDTLDALVVATPDDTHAPIALAALDASLHLLCEKPIALNAADAQAMYEKAEAAGVNHMTFFSWRWTPYARHVRALLDDGYLGRTYRCHLRFLGSHARDGQYQWRFDQRRANGILGDLGSHMIDMARWLVGDIAKVNAQLGIHVPRTGIPGEPFEPANDTAHLLLEFADGAQGVIEVSAVGLLGARGMEQSVVLHGAEGSIDLQLYFDSHAILQCVRADGSQHDAAAITNELWGDVDRNESLLSQFDKIYYRQAVGTRLFIDDILAGRKSSPSLYDGWQAQRVIDAAFESQRRGGWVAIED